MTFTVKGAVLKAAQENQSIDVEDLMQDIGVSRAQVLCAMKKLRNEGRLKRVQGSIHAYIQGSVHRSSNLHDPGKVERQRKAEKARQQRMEMLALPIVQAARISSPVSVWAYARGFA